MARLCVLVLPLGHHLHPQLSRHGQNENAGWYWPSIITCKARHGQIELNVLWSNTILPCSIYHSVLLSRFAMPGFSEWVLMNVYDSTYALLAQQSRGMARLSWHHVVEYDFAMFRLYRYRSVKIIVSLRHAWLFRSTSTVSYDVYVLTCWYVGIVWHPLIWLSPKHWSVGSWQRPAPFGTWYGNL